MKLSDKTHKLVCYICITLFAVLFLFVGHNVASSGMPDLYDGGSTQTFQAEVTKILDETYEEKTFEASVASGKESRTVIASQKIEIGTKAVSTGDKVILSGNPDSGWRFVDYPRINIIIMFACLFMIALLVFGRVKGLNTILSLGLTCASIFAVFIPAFLSGKNIYIATSVVCVFSIVVALLIVNGVNRKTFAAVTGCIGGVVVAGILAYVMNELLDIRGFISEDRQFLMTLPTGSSYQLKQIVFAGILMGAVGAATDVGMSISSGLWELKCNAPKMTFREYLKSGIRIGQDIVCTMTNTLVLAYVGSSLSVVLVLMYYVDSFAELINSDSVIIELFQSLAGSFGILATMPLTALICALLYQKTKPGRVLV